MTPNSPDILVRRSLLMDNNDQGGQTDKAQNLLKLCEMRSLGKA